MVTYEKGDRVYHTGHKKYGIVTDKKDDKIKVEFDGYGETGYAGPKPTFCKTTSYQPAAKKRERDVGPLTPSKKANKQVRGSACEREPAHVLLDVLLHVSTLTDSLRCVFW